MMDLIVDKAHDSIGAGIEYIYSYGPLAEKTVILVFPFVKELVSKLSAAIGFDQETLSYTIGLFLCYPLGLLMHLLPYGKARHIFSFVLGVFLLQFTIGKQWVHHMITVLISYCLFVLVPYKQCIRIVPLFVMTYLTVGHLHRQYVNYLGWDLGFHTTHMILAIKLYSISYNLYDGQMLSQNKGDRAAKKCSDVALFKLPSLLEFLGYTFNFSTVLAGPAFEFKMYDSACDGSNLYHLNDDGTVGKPKGKIPSNVMPTLKPFLTSLFCMCMFVFGSKKFPILDPHDAKSFIPVVLSDDFVQNNSFLYRTIYFWIGLAFVRQKYYFAWKNVEGSCNLWYAGFEGFDKDGNAKGWDNSSNVDIWIYETAPNFKVGSGAWNKKTAGWLSKYIYFRTGGNLIMTYMTSAFWHGFYPGYYMFFLSIPLLTACERLSAQKISPYFSSDKWSLYGISAILCTMFVVTYLTHAFQLLSYESAITNWKNDYFYGHLLLIAFFGVVSNFPSPKKEKKTE